MDSEFVRRQWRRIVFGCVTGTLVSAAIHFLTRDGAAAVYLWQRVFKTSARLPFDVVGSLRAELIVLAVAVSAGAVVPTAMWAWRFVRAWWAGIVSVVFSLVAAIATTALLYGRHPVIAVGIGLVLLVGVVGIEYWRNLPRRHVPGGPLQLNIPPRSSGGSPRIEPAGPSGDDPIRAWNDDLLDRVAVVELLADYGICQRIPVVALNGDLGDGKSSVLNLVQCAVKGQAIVVPFSAWLPGSEATFAGDLFRDIASACRKYVYVPQLRKRSLTYARILSGSISYLAGLKELLPASSQQREIAELRDSFSRVPLPILVLLDEVDRMHKDELFVLLKVLRGASSIPNVTFICAFSETEIRRELSKEGQLSYDYLEKFFPVSVSLSAPDPQMLGKYVHDRIESGLAELGYFRDEKRARVFADIFDRLWSGILVKICTNLRKAKLLINDTLAAAQPIAGEVDALDLVAIECVRQFYPDVYRMVRVNPLYLAYTKDGWTKAQFLAETHKEAGIKDFFEPLEATIATCHAPSAARDLLSFMFPEYARATGGKSLHYQFVRNTNEEIAEDEKRICGGDYFSIYFRGAVPEQMFSNAELAAFAREVNESDSDAAVGRAFDDLLEKLPAKDPKREDFLWKLGRRSDTLTDEALERLSTAAAIRANSYAYDILNVGEASRALNIVFIAAQRLSETDKAQRILEDAIAHATDDTFARRVLEFTESPDRNKVLTNFAKIDVAAVKNALIERMRRRYGPAANPQSVKISEGDWRAFRWWAGISDQDREIEQDFWRRFIGDSRTRLAQAVNFIYPDGGVWEENPVQVVGSLFPMNELADLLNNLPAGEVLPEIEAKGLNRLRDLLDGEYPNFGNM